MSAYSALILSESSLVAYFRLGETVGSTAVTDSKASNTAASTGSSTTLGVTGILPTDATATGATFTGTGVFTGSAGLQTALNFDRTNAFSIEAWVKPSVGRGSGVQTQVILDHRSSASTNQGYILFMAWNAGSSQTRIQFQLNNNISGGANSLAMETTSIDMANGTIYHVVFTYDGSSTPGGCKVWVNGVSQTLATDFNTLSSSIQTTQVPLIGNVTGGGTLPWQGTLQELAVYSATLTSGQVFRHYLTGALVGPATAKAAAFIQVVPNHVGGSFQTSQSLTLTVTAGDLILVGVGGHSITGTGVTDSQFNLYVFIAAATDDYIASLYAGYATSSGSLTVTSHFTNPSNFSSDLIVAEYAGLYPFDVVAAKVGSAAHMSDTLPTLVTVYPADWLVLFSFNGPFIAASFSPSDYAIRLNDTIAGSTFSLVADGTAAPAGTYGGETFSWTTNSVKESVILIAMKAAAGNAPFLLAHF